MMMKHHSKKICIRRLKHSVKYHRDRFDFDNCRLCCDGVIMFITESGRLRVGLSILLDFEFFNSCFNHGAFLR
jgi:hypothetical protein